MASEQEPQLTPKQRRVMEAEQYRFAGSHSAVKACHWTKESIRGRGVCYKQKFYGIRSHQCLQMTTAMYCANRCLFCWRGEKAPVFRRWTGKTDEPEYIIRKSIEEHIKLLIGFQGSSGANKKMLSGMKDVRHAALSLTGEPIEYPRFNELIKGFHKKKISTFVVTNGQYPEKIKGLDSVTQLYLSVDAPNKALLKKIDVPLFRDYWARLNRSLRFLSEKSCRTAVRITLIKGLNDKDIKGYKKLITAGNPDFIEVKGYMHVGHSMKNLKKSNMPIHEDVKRFSKILESSLPYYHIAEEHTPSRVVLLMRRSLRKKRFIDFEKFFEAVKYGREIRAEDISSCLIMHEREERPKSMRYEKF